MANMSRRKFVGMTSAAVAATYLPWRLGARPALAAFYNNRVTTRLFATQFRGIADIPVAAPDLGAAPITGVKHYTIDIQQFTDTIHPNTAFANTKLWGYHPARVLPNTGLNGPAHLGGIIVAKKGEPIQLTFRNKLVDGAGNPLSAIIPIDTSIEGVLDGDGKRRQDNRTAVHLHGGFIPWISDGGPHTWFDSAGHQGLSFLNNDTLNPAAAANEAEYYWPMDLSARMLWYHDHAWGITRTNAYAGIATALLIRDDFEKGLIGNRPGMGLPDYVENGGRELPIVVQDKIFVGPDIATADPTWTGSTEPGSLWYAHAYDTALFGKLGPAPAGPPPGVSCVPEFFGDTMLANGTVYPEVTVEARRYRLRILNACNARFLNLQMYIDDGTPNGITLGNQGVPLNMAALNAAAPGGNGNPSQNWLVLGTEGGFLPQAAYVASNVPFNGTTAAGSMLLAPAERADVLFDFKAHAGQKIILYTDCPAPFPGGAPTNDYFPGLNNKNPVNAVTPAGSGPNTRVIMRFNVVAATGTDAPLSITKGTDFSQGIAPVLVKPGATTVPTGIPIRRLTLNEGFDKYGRLIQMLGTNVPVAAGGYGQEYLATPTEVVRAGTTEIWQIANLTADTHPIHFHLVNVQIISRQAFNGFNGGIPNLQGAPLPPARNEFGWKETVRMNPGEVTTVIMRFDLPADPPGVTIPASPRTGGYEYVWHCHILEHEEHDMMRPLVVF